jgi:hypothetical protein
MTTSNMATATTTTTSSALASRATPRLPLLI